MAAVPQEEKLAAHLGRSTCVVKSAPVRETKQLEKRFGQEDLQHGCDSHPPSLPIADAGAPWQFKELELVMYFSPAAAWAREDADILGRDRPSKPRFLSSTASLVLFDRSLIPIPTCWQRGQGAMGAQQNPGPAGFHPAKVAVS